MAGDDVGRVRAHLPKVASDAAEEAGRDDVGGRVLERGIRSVSSSLSHFGNKIKFLTHALAGQVGFPFLPVLEHSTRWMPLLASGCPRLRWLR